MSVWSSALIANAPITAAASTSRKGAVQPQRSGARVRERTAVGDGDSDRDLASALDAALERLPAHYREAILLHYLGNRGVAEAAVLAGRAEPAFALQSTQALKRLRQLLSRQSGTAVSACALAALLMRESSVTVPARTLAAMKAAGR